MLVFLTIWHQDFVENTAVKLGVRSATRTPLESGQKVKGFDTNEPGGDCPSPELMGCLMWFPVTAGYFPRSYYCWYGCNIAHGMAVVLPLVARLIHWC